MKSLLFIILAVWFLLYLDMPMAAERINFGTAVKHYPPYYLPVVAAAEKGLWRDNGFDGEWVSFRGGGPFMHALAARSIKVGYTRAATTFRVASQGLSIIIVSDHFRSSTSFWVKGDSRFKEPRDLKGIRVGVTGLADTAPALGQVVLRSLGLEKEVKFVGVGGAETRMAALKGGAIDAFIIGFLSVAEAAVKGEIREVIRIDSYLPQEWVDEVTVAHRAFVKQEQPLARRVLKASLESVRFVTANKDWTLGRLKEISGYSDRATQLVYEELRHRFTSDGRAGQRALENLKNFLLEYNLLPREKAPTISEVYTEELLPQ